MDSAEEVFARKCIATLLEMPEEWKPLSEIPETAEAQDYQKVLIGCGYCEAEQEYSIRLIDGDELTVKFVSHGRPASTDGAAGAVHPEVEKLLTEHLPDSVDTNVPCICRTLRVRPTIVGQHLRQKFSGNTDEAVVGQLAAMIQNPPPYSVGNFHVVPVKVAAGKGKGKKRGRRPAQATDDEKRIIRIIESGQVRGPGNIAREAGVFDKDGEPKAGLVKTLQSRLSAQRRRMQKKSSDDVA